jgi:hypothetical protein
MASVEIRDKLPFIQDAFVRDVNAAPIGKAGDPLAVDRDALATRLTAEARRIVGSRKVATITFVETPLHPKATTDDPAPPAFGHDAKPQAARPTATTPPP